MAVEWQTIPIREVYAGMYDGPHATPKPSESGPIFLGIKNVGETGQLDLSSIRHISEEEYPRWIKRVEPRHGDIVFSYEATLNRYAMIPKGFRGCLGRRMALIRPDNSKICGRFLYYYLFGQKWRNVIAQNTLIGSTVDRIPIAKFPDFPITIPPLPTQRKIASILSAYDDLIENNLRRIKILEEMAQALYREWFVKFRFPGHEKVRMVDSPLGKIPEGWKVVRLDGLVSFQNRGTKAGNHLSDHVYLPIDCLPRRSLAINEVKPWEEAQSSLHLFDNSDILFGAMRPYFHKVVVAPFKGVTRKTCFVFKSQRPEYHAFSALTLFEDSTISFANAHSRGATIPYAVWDAGMDGMPVICPPERLAQRFEEMVDPMILEITGCYFKNRNLRQTRDLLLPRLISGELDVSNLDISITEEAA